MKKTAIIIMAAVMAFSAAPVVALAADTNAQTEQQNKKKKVKEVKDVNFNVYLHCEDCIEKVNENIAFEKGVKGLEVSLEDQTVSIKYDASKTSEEVLKAAIEKLGYPVYGKLEPGQEPIRLEDLEGHEGHDHGHDHGHNHGHDHNHDHDHGHDHNHSH